MNRKNKILFSDYTELFITPENRRFADFWKINAVRDFLNSNHTVSEKGIQKYLASIDNSAISKSDIKTELCKLLVKPAAKDAKTNIMPILSEKGKTDVTEFGEYLVVEQSYSPNTARSYQQTMREFFNIFKEFNQTNAVAFKNHSLALGLRPKTLNLRISGLVAYAKWKNINLKIKRVKVPRILECNNVPDKSQMSKFLTFCKSYNFYWYLVFRCLSTTGLRIHELLKLTYDDILSGDTLINGKGGKIRRVFFQKRFIAEIEEYLKNNSHILRSDRFCPKTARGVAQQMQAYAKKADQDKSKFHPHAFRHYFAKMYLAKRPDDLIGLQGLLGHSSLETTAIYLRRSRQELFDDYTKTVNWE